MNSMLSKKRFQCWRVLSATVCEASWECVRGWALAALQPRVQHHPNAGLPTHYAHDVGEAQQQQLYTTSVPHDAAAP